MKPIEMVFVALLSLWLLGNVFLPLQITAFFTDSFESGDFSAWSGVHGSPEVVSERASHGDYSVKFSPSAYQYQDCYVEFPSLTTVYARHYRFLTTFSGTRWVFEYTQTNPWLVFFHLYIGPDTLRAELPETDYDYSYSFQSNTWYSFEVKLVVNTPTNGELRVWLDGTEVITQIELNLSSVSYVNRATFGQFHNVISYVDNVAIADAGPIGTGTPPSQPLTIGISPTVKTVNTGETATFIATASRGEPPYSYTWHVNDSLLSGETSSTLTLSEENTGTYNIKVTVTDNAETTASAEATLFVSETSSPDTPQTYTLVMNITGSGSITPDVGTYEYTEGTIVNLVATPDTDWVFNYWDINGAEETKADIQLTMDTNYVVEAHFSQNYTQPAPSPSIQPHINAIQFNIMMGCATVALAVILLRGKRKR